MKKQLLMSAFALLVTASLSQAQSLGTDTVTTNLNVTVAPEAALTIQTADTNFSAPANFADYTAGPTNFTYFVRTAKAAGTGNIQLKITTDFSPSGGPSVTTPPTATDKLTYTCTVPAASSGSVTPCSGETTASTAADTLVATFGADTRSPKAGVASSVSWKLSNDPLYETGSYTAVATFTISAH